MRIKFSGSQGSQLSAKIDEPEFGISSVTVLFAHCFTCSKNLRAVGHISKALTDEGMGVFRFDFTGLGESEGDFADTNFSSNIDDFIAAAEYMKKEWEPPRILMGHSFGGAAVSKFDGGVTGIVSTCGQTVSGSHHSPACYRSQMLSGRAFGRQPGAFGTSRRCLHHP